MMVKLRDKFWIWGHPAGSHNSGYGLSQKSRMTPAEGAYYLGVRNMMMVCYRDQPKPPFEQEAKSFDPLREVVWSVVGDGSSSNQSDTLGNLNEILLLAKTHKNITGGIFDDFFKGQREKEYTPEQIHEVQQKLHNEAPHPLDLWVVIYNQQLDHLPIQDYLQSIDGFTFWTWLGKDLVHFEQNFQKLKQVAPRQRILLGCYLYNYGEGREMTTEQMSFQLEHYTKKVRSGEAEGIILLSNTVADLGFEGVEYVKQWLEVYGDELV